MEDKTSKTENMDELEYEVINYVPYQLCPKCNGDGNLMRFNSPAIMGTNTAPTCDVCNGNKIISMHIINDNLASLDVLDGGVKE